MQISLEELQRVARAYRAQRAGAVPLEPVPAPFVASDAEDERLAREIARELVGLSETREERVQAAQRALSEQHEAVPAEVIAASILRRVLADRLSETTESP